MSTQSKIVTELPARYFTLEEVKEQQDRECINGTDSRMNHYYMKMRNLELKRKKELEDANE